MSRIYKPVSSRSGVCITDRNLGIQTHSGGMIKIRAGGQFAVGAPKIPTEPSVQSVQHKVEQLHLRDQEVLQKSNTEEVQNQKVCQHQKKPTEQMKPHPTATAKAPLFTVRSASGGKGKRGTTFTITPRPSAPSATSSSDTTLKVASPSSSTPGAPIHTAELTKKRYPTAEEIEVIGGYQRLGRSCLMKNQGSPKTVRVSFNDCPVSVCTYPPEEESSDDWRREEEKQEEPDEDVCMDEVCGTGSGLSRVLRVDESCQR